MFLVLHRFLPGIECQDCDVQYFVSEQAGTSKQTCTKKNTGVLTVQFVHNHTHTPYSHKVAAFEKWLVVSTAAGACRPPSPVYLPMVQL